MAGKMPGAPWGIYPRRRIIGLPRFLFDSGHIIHFLAGSGKAGSFQNREQTCRILSRGRVLIRQNDRNAEPRRGVLPPGKN